MNAPATLTVELEPEQFRRLDEAAARAAMTPADAMKQALDAWLERRTRFERVRSHLLDKHDEALRRLAQ